MEKNRRLFEELNKILTLSGLENKILQEEIQIEPDEDGLKYAKQDFEKESEKEISKVAKQESDYLQTNESQFLSFPMKVSMLIRDKSSYLKLMQNIIELLYYREANSMGFFKPGVIDDKKNSEIRNSQIIKKVIETIAPEFSKTNITTMNDLLKAISTNVIKKSNELLNDKFKKVNLGDDIDDFKNLEIKRRYLEKIGAYEELQSLADDEELIRKSFTPNNSDQKATISYNFNANPNDFKLTPLGFWQIQFLARVAANKPKNELEEILFKNQKYAGVALATLKDFYMHVFFPMLAILTGRNFNIHPDDTEFKIMQDSSWDKVVDGLITGKYDVSKNNFGAWAITVARNAVIDEIKSITNIEFIPTQDTLSSIAENNIDKLDFKKPLESLIPRIRVSKEESEPIIDVADYCKLISTSEGTDLHNLYIVYTYQFYSPDKLFDFFNDINSQETTTKKGFKKLKGIPYSLVSQLTPYYKKMLTKLGAFKSVKKFADIWPEESEENTNDLYQSKAKNEEKDRILQKLYELYKSRTEMSINKKSFQETKEYEAMVDSQGNKLYSDEEIENAFQRDMGTALFYYQTEFIKNFPHLETKIPGDAINAVLEKYVKPLPENTNVEKIYKNEAYKYIDKTLREKSKGDVIGNPILFKNKSINNSIIPELEPFVRYDYKVARNMKKEDIIPALRQEFSQQQKDFKEKEIENAKTENRKPKPVYTFYDRLDEMFIQVGRAVSGLMNIKKEKNEMPLVQKIELLSKFSNLLTRLTGFNIQLEESKNFSIKEINNYLLEIKQNIIKKTLL